MAGTVGCPGPEISPSSEIPITSCLEFLWDRPTLLVLGRYTPPLFCVQMCMSQVPARPARTSLTLCLRVLQVMRALVCPWQCRPPANFC